MSQRYRTQRLFWFPSRSPWKRWYPFSYGKRKYTIIGPGSVSKATKYHLQRKIS